MNVDVPVFFSRRLYLNRFEFELEVKETKLDDFDDVSEDSAMIKSKKVQKKY